MFENATTPQCTYLKFQLEQQYNAGVVKTREIDARKYGCRDYQLLLIRKISTVRTDRRFEAGLVSIAFLSGLVSERGGLLRVLRSATDRILALGTKGEGQLDGYTPGSRVVGGNVCNTAESLDRSHRGRTAGFGYSNVKSWDYSMCN